jgi:hypothetical protein
MIYNYLYLRYPKHIGSGIAACRAANNSMFVDGDDFYEKIIDTEFQGTSGNVTLNKETGSKSPNSTTAYDMFNLSIFRKNRITKGKVRQEMNFTLNLVQLGNSSQANGKLLEILHSVMEVQNLLQKFQSLIGKTVRLT